MAKKPKTEDHPKAQPPPLPPKAPTSVRLEAQEFNVVAETLALFPYGQVVQAMGALMQARQRAERGTQ